MNFLTYLFTYIKGEKFVKERKWHVKWLVGRARSTIHSTTEFEICRNAGPSALQFQESMLKSDKI